MDSRRRGAGGSAAGGAAPDDVVATLRLLVALEDYLGSLGPKLVDLLAEALKMEKVGSTLKPCSCRHILYSMCVLDIDKITHFSLISMFSMFWIPNELFLF